MKQSWRAEKQSESSEKSGNFNGLREDVLYLTRVTRLPSNPCLRPVLKSKQNSPGEHFLLRTHHREAAMHDAWWGEATEQHSITMNASEIGAV